MRDLDDLANERLIIGGLDASLLEIIRPTLLRMSAFQINSDAEEPPIQFALRKLQYDKEARNAFAAKTLSAIQLAEHSRTAISNSHGIILPESDEMTNSVLFSFAKRLGKPAFALRKSSDFSGMQIEFRYSDIELAPLTNLLFVTPNSDRSMVRNPQVSELRLDREKDILLWLDAVSLSNSALNSANHYPLQTAFERAYELKGALGLPTKVVLTNTSVMSAETIHMTIEYARRRLGRETQIETHRSKPRLGSRLWSHKSLILAASAFNAVGLATASKRTPYFANQSSYDFLKLGRVLSPVVGNCILPNQYPCKRELFERKNLIGWFEQNYLFGANKKASLRLQRVITVNALEKTHVKQMHFYSGTTSGS